MDKKSDNFLDFVPVRKLEWQVQENGRVCLIKEKTRNRFLKAFIKAVRRSQFFHINLDELGSEAWLLADGKRSVYDVCRQMEEKFGDRVIPAAHRVSHFFAIMKRNGFVDLKKMEKKS